MHWSTGIYLPYRHRNHILTYNLKSFGVPLFTAANRLVYVKNGNKLGFRVMDRGSVRVIRVRVRVSCQVVWCR